MLLLRNLQVLNLARIKKEAVEEYDAGAESFSFDKV